MAHPTTEMLLSQEHSDDLPRFAAMLKDISRAHGAFSTRHRIIDTRGAVHSVVVVADHLTDATGAVIGIHGF